MDVELLIAGWLTVGLAIGHETVGQVWVLPSVTEERLPRTGLGSAGLSERTIRVTWHIVTVFALALGGLLVSLAWWQDLDPMTLLLRWFAAMWVVATAMALWLVRRTPRALLRLPVPLVWLVIAGLLWTASM